MKFFNVCDDLLKTKKLQKIRVKVDPAWSKTLGSLYSPSFEGYILGECSGCNGGERLKVFIVNVPPGFSSVQNVPISNIEPLRNEPQEVQTGNYSKLTLLKKAILDKMIDMGKDKEDSDVKQVLVSKDIGFIETFLRQMGLTEEDLLNLYRKCFKKI
jgi:hypothetical protein